MNGLQAQTWNEALGCSNGAQGVHEFVSRLYASQLASSLAVFGSTPPKDSTLPSPRRTACGHTHDHLSLRSHENSS